MKIDRYIEVTGENSNQIKTFVNKFNSKKSVKKNPPSKQYKESDIAYTTGDFICLMENDQIEVKDEIGFQSYLDENKTKKKLKTSKVKK